MRQSSSAILAQRDSDIPDFPTDVPIAPLRKISLKKLQQGDREESEQFFQACKDLGFFYLNLEDCSDGESLMHDAKRLFAFGEKLYDEDLTSYDYSERKTYFGYKRVGKAKVDENGTPDRNEFYNIPKDDILQQSTSPLPHPPFINNAQPLLSSFAKGSHQLAIRLLSLLTKHLQLTPPTTLESLHRITEPSGDHVRVIKAAPQPAGDRRTALGAHTDYGSLTILFNRVGGLQVHLPPSVYNPPHAPADGWYYVHPQSNHAIINVGDALSKFSNSLLRSAVHRVAAPPGKQADLTRYSLMYFCRPEDAVVLKRLEGKAVPVFREGEDEGEVLDSKAWILRKAMRQFEGLSVNGGVAVK